MGAFERLNRLISRHSDIIVAGLIVTILGLMIVRVPPRVMDVFIGTNIALSATVLMVALYVPNAMKLPSFPTILLITTLFRLALNVSTTRLILLEANAGEIIFAFGDFVVGGNFVVGGVVFLVLVLIQFIVIAKGSERVAEVSARFTLDAMPGKQMSIDADLRAGLIAPEDARERRRELEQESKLYGAMDGAMKFVKGDAMAGIIISLVNIIGGLIVGVMQQGMAVGEAAQVYSLLTIGDGLVSQIPALLLSVAAGLVVTRVAAGDGEGSHVAQEMFEQVMGQPKAIALVAVILFGMSFLPGFPMIVFWVLGLVAAVVSFSSSVGAMYGSMEAEEGLAEAELEAGETAARGRPDGPTAAALGPIPVLLELHPEIAPLFIERREATGPGGPSMVSRARPEVLADLSRLRSSLEQEMGFPFPPIVLRTDDRHFTVPGYAIVLFDAPIAQGSVLPDQVFCICRVAPDEAEQLGLAALVPLPWSRLQVPAVTAAEVEPLREKLAAREGDDGRLVPISARDAILAHLRVVLIRHASDLLGIQEACDLLESLKESRPDLVKAVVPVLITPAQLTEVLQGLLHEQIAIADMRLILESIARWGPKLRRDAQQPIDVPTLTEYVRHDLRRTFCGRFAASRSLMPYYSVAPDLEQVIVGAMEPSGDGAVFALTPEERSMIVEAFEAAIDPYEHLQHKAVVVVNQAAVRRPLAQLLESSLPEVIVLTYQDLVPELNPQSLKIVMLEQPAAAEGVAAS